ncbi:MAG: hypothetical protein IMZ60_04390 [Actinobacteria bacterium]|nr:hypothetical protein [Actinomycetota bacterium]
MKKVCQVNNSAIFSGKPMGFVEFLTGRTLGSGFTTSQNVKRKQKKKM